MFGRRPNSPANIASYVVMCLSGNFFLLFSWSYDAVADEFGELGAGKLDVAHLFH